MPRCGLGSIHARTGRLRRPSRFVSVYVFHGEIEIVGDIREDECAEDIWVPEGDRGVVDQGLGVEMGEVADLRVGCLLGEGDEDLGGPGAVDGVVGLEFLGVPVGGAEATVLERGGVGLSGDDPAGVQGAEFDFGTIFDGECFVGEEAAGGVDESEGLLGRWVLGLNHPPELFVEGERVG